MFLLALFWLSSCGGSHSPSTPTPPAPTLTCPADQHVIAHLGQPAAVSFETPAAQGGAAPVTVACAPASGTSFALGTTPVTCTATDTSARTATCGFSVEVARAPRTSAVKFVAFGDSITYGTTSPDISLFAVDPTKAYPFLLQQSLTARYVDQTITVINAGKPGERLEDDGQSRFRSVLNDKKPDVVLLLHGANDLLAAAHAGDPSRAIDDIIDALADCISAAERRHVEVMLATFPPQDAKLKRGIGAPALPSLNNQIRRLAANHHAALVDLFNGLGGTTEGSIGSDGLHPTTEGYVKIAQIWMDAIVKTYDEPASGARPLLVLPSSPSSVPSN